MALPLPLGMTPSEVAFLCEMEMVTVIPRQRLESLNLLGGSTPSLQPPHRSNLPLWFALLLKRQKRANILPPPWLLHSSLERILEKETEIYQQTFSLPAPHPYAFSAGSKATDRLSTPFLPSSTADAPPDFLPYHWLELGKILLDACSDDIPDAERVRGLLRDVREVRMAKIRNSVKELESGAISSLRGVGAMEIAESRGFVVGIMDGLRKISASQEVSRRERDDDEDELDEESDIDMTLG